MPLSSVQIVLTVLTTPLSLLPLVPTTKLIGDNFALMVLNTQMTAWRLSRLHTLPFSVFALETNNLPSKLYIISSVFF